jgi:post-segregation antitoxin (ccd killing protein)
MNVTTIKMDPAEARKKIEAWMQEKHADQAWCGSTASSGYAALAAGKKLVQLDAAIRGGGFHASGFPKLAIARADRREVRLMWRRGNHEAIFDAHDQFRSGRQSASLTRRINMQRAPDKWYDGYAQIPLLPAELRPEKGQLRDWFILWEVERWYARSLDVQPDRDPMLLEHVAGQLYAVLAEWDLTELERAVMAGALSPEA